MFKIGYLLHGSPRQFHQAICTSAFEGIIFHVCPKAKATGVLNVQEKNFF